MLHHRLSNARASMYGSCKASNSWKISLDHRSLRVVIGLTSDTWLLPTIWKPAGECGIYGRLALSCSLSYDQTLIMRLIGCAVCDGKEGNWRILQQAYTTKYWGQKEKEWLDVAFACRTYGSGRVLVAPKVGSSAAVG